MIKSLFGGKKKKQGYFLELDEKEENQGNSSTVTAESEAPEKPVEEKKVELAKPEAKKEKTVKKTSIKKAASTSPTTTSGQPEWVKLLYTKNESQNGEVENTEDNTFATKYLMSTPSKSRRRPGGSMKKFMDMAREARV